MNIPTRLSQKIIFKSVIIILILLFLVNLILISRSRVAGYEDSIYSNIPDIVWIFLELSIMCSIILMTIFDEKDSYWVAGLVIILINNMLVVMLPVIKGYAFYGNGDPLTHIGMIKDIISYGDFGTNNLYPITHTLFSEIAILTNIPPLLLYSIMPAFFYMLFVLFIYLLAKTILIKQKEVMIATAAAGTIFFLWGYHTQLVPNGIADFFYPLFMAVFYRNNIKNSINFNILLLILIALFPFFHPLTTFSLIFSILLFKLSFYVLEVSNPGLKGIFSKIRQKATLPMLMVLIVFIVWISTFLVWGQTLRQIFNFIGGEAKVTPLDGMANTLDRINLKGFDFLVLLLKMYGQHLLFFAFSALASFIIIKKILHERKFEYQNHFSLAVIFICLCLFLVGFLLVPMPFGNMRMMSYPTIISIILGSFGIHAFIMSILNKKKYIAPLAISIILIIPAGVGIFSIFDSPYILKPNLQITHAEIDGYKWTVVKKNPEISVSAIMSVQPFRFVDALWGLKARKERKDIERYGEPEAIIPDHFNYTNYSMAGSSYPYDRYIFFSESDKRLYTGVWKFVGRYNSTDFERISFDPTMQKIYSNGGFDTFIVKSIK